MEASLSAATRAATNPCSAPVAFWPGIGGKPERWKQILILTIKWQHLVKHMSRWQCRLPLQDCRTRNTIKPRFTELSASWKLHHQLINLDRKMISPGGTGSSSKLTSFPNLWARMALWYCCRRREVEYSNTAEQMLILWSKRKKDLLQEIHCFQSLFWLYSFVYIFLTFKYHTHDKFW